MTYQTKAAVNGRRCFLLLRPRSAVQGQSKGGCGVSLDSNNNNSKGQISNCANGAVNLPNIVGLVKPTILKRVAKLQLDDSKEKHKISRGCVQFWIYLISPNLGGCAQNFVHLIVGYVTLQHPPITTHFLGRLVCLTGYDQFCRHPDIGYRTLWGCAPLPYTLEKSRCFSRCSYMRNGQPFGSIPFFRKASRPNSLIQLARLTPSDCASFSNCSFNSGLIRIWNGGDFPAPRDWLSLVDMCTPIGIWLFIGVHLNMCVPKITTPRTARTDPGRLTKPLIGVTVMAESQHTQTHPKFTWRFLCTSSRWPDAKPLVIYVNAASEQDARDTMPGVTLIFAARLPLHAFQMLEVRYA